MTGSRMQGDGRPAEVPECAIGKTPVLGTSAGSYRSRDDLHTALNALDISAAWCSAAREGAQVAAVRLSGIGIHQRGAVLYTERRAPLRSNAAADVL